MSDASEDSDNIGYLIEESERDECDESDESASDSGTDHDRNGFLDLEAHDDDDESESGGSDSTSDDGGDLWSDTSDLEFFPQFKRLPFELRQRIWEFFCPDLAAKSRVYWFQILPQHNPRDRQSTSTQIWEGPLLEQQTRPARTMMAVHQESRRLALKAFPDTLFFRRRKQFVRFNAKRDIVFLDSVETIFEDQDTVPKIRGFSEHIRHLAIDSMVLNERGRLLAPNVLAAFENLETVYYTTEPTEHKPEHLRWCASRLVKHYHLSTFEQQLGLGEDADHLYCWPDVENHLSFAENEIPLDGMAENLLKDGTDVKDAQVPGLKIWPMVTFLWESDMRRFDRLLTWDGEQDIEWGSSDEEDDSEPDEYESEGIDDSDISEDSSGSEDDLVVLDDGTDQDESEHGNEDGASVVSAPSLAGHENFPIDLTDDVDTQSIARFSSPEQSSSTVRQTDESDSEQAAPRGSRLKRPRGRVVESDSGDESEEHHPPKRARTEGRRTVVVLSDDDEEEERRKMRTNRRVRAVLPDDDDEDEDEDDDQHGNEGQTRDGNDESSEISSSDEHEESPGGAAVSRSLSLAEKLQLHREQVPIPPSDDDDSDIEEMAGDDYDARDYADFQDDEEGNEISEDSGDDDDENGLMMDDTDGDEEGYEDDEY